MWDHDKDDGELIRLFDSGLSTNEIARAMNKSRNQIIGQCYRQGLSKKYPGPEGRAKLIKERQEKTHARSLNPGVGRGRAKERKKADTYRDAALTEKWADFHRRKAAERAAEKAKAVSHNDQSVDQNPEK